MLICIHFVLQTSLFIFSQSSRDPEAGLAFGMVQLSISYPTSLAILKLDRVASDKRILWESDLLFTSKVDHYVDRFFGFTKQTVEDFIFTVLLVIAGTLQWGIVGILIQSVWRRLRGPAQTHMAN